MWACDLTFVFVLRINFAIGVEEELARRRRVSSSDIDGVFLIWGEINSSIFSHGSATIALASLVARQHCFDAASTIRLRARLATKHAAREIKIVFLVTKSIFAIRREEFINLVLCEAGARCSAENRFASEVLRRYNLTIAMNKNC